jgi:hypothetical protein
VKYPRKIELLTGWGCFFILLVTYWLTVAPTVSYWDCPEYVSAAWLLEVGHPPGNPVWMLVERMITMLAPSGEYAALAVNLSSGLFTAFAGFFLARTIFRVAVWILRARPKSPVNPTLLAAAASVIGSLAFGWCDSVWFSAVEAEVYAMSIFMTSLCLWLMVKWAYTPSRPAAWRLLILIAYLFGLGIGVHQLNLLLIPALALIWAFKRGIRKMRSLLLIEILSLGAVGSICSKSSRAPISIRRCSICRALGSLFIHSANRYSTLYQPRCYGDNCLPCAISLRTFHIQWQLRCWCSSCRSVRYVISTQR